MPTRAQQTGLVAVLTVLAVYVAIQLGCPGSW
jgi:hypothetical protein